MIQRIYNADGRPAALNLNDLLSSDALRYGRGLFETMLVEPERIRNGVLHIERLSRCAEQFGLSAPSYDRLAEILIECAESAESERSRLRISLLGLIRRASVVLVEVDRLQSDSESSRSGGVTLSVVPDVTRTADGRCGCKTTGYLVEDREIRSAVEEGVFDRLFFGPNDTIVEGARSNFFVGIGPRLLTPPISDGAVDGTMRRRVLDAANERGFAVDQRSVTMSEVAQADEVFVTNSLRGVVSVGTVFGREGDPEVSTSSDAFATILRSDVGTLDIRFDFPL